MSLSPHNITEMTRIGHYDILDCMGPGGMGLVYLAHDAELNRQVAVKVLNTPELTEDLRERMIREAQIIAQLEHPGIVPVHDVGVFPDGRVFYAMKYVRGDRLDECRGGIRLSGSRAAAEDRYRASHRLRQLAPLMFANRRNVGGIGPDRREDDRLLARAVKHLAGNDDRVIGQPVDQADQKVARSHRRIDDGEVENGGRRVVSGERRGVGF